MKIKHRRRQRNQVHRLEVLPITLYHQKVSSKLFASLPEEDRYCLLLAGHIHDELNWLQRMAYIATRQQNYGSSVERGGKMMQTTMLVRLLLGKLWEFHECFSPKNSLLRAFVIRYYMPEQKGAGSNKVNEILSAFETERWLRTVRNKHFLHYPKFGDIREALNDSNMEWHFESFHGKNSVNTFYPTSDVLANYSWFKRVNLDEPTLGFEDAIDALIQLTQLTLNGLEVAIAHFIDVHLVHFGDSKQITLSGPRLSSLKLPYFVAV